MTGAGDRILGCLLAACLAGAGASRATPAIRGVKIFDDGAAHVEPGGDPDPARVVRIWPFCPTDRIPCLESQLAWVQLEIAVDVYSARRNDPHDSIQRIVDATRGDLAPLVAALQAHFTARDVGSDAARVAFTHGLVQAIDYQLDAQTGWTEYPKFGVELLVDEQGDCDDAAIVNTVLLHGLGYDSYFVHWTGPGEGHLSTAVVPDRGDLRGFEPPPGSSWVEPAGGPRLLHVDATGTPGGCGGSWGNCMPLGFNRWSEQGLEVATVAAAGDPEIASRIPISAWSNGGLERPDRELVDRRNAGEVAEEATLDPERSVRRTRRRLTGLGLDEQRVGVYLRPRYPYDRTSYYFYLAFCLSIVGIAAAIAWHRRRLRLRRVAESRERDLREGF